MKREQGFTLMEVIVVLAILSVLITYAVPRYIGIRKHFYLEEGLNILQEIKGAENAYAIEHGCFAPDLQALGFVMPGGSHFASPVLVPGQNAQPCNDGGFTVMNIKMNGRVSPLDNKDHITLTLVVDGPSILNENF